MAKITRSATSRGQDRAAKINALSKVAKKGLSEGSFSSYRAGSKAAAEKSKLWKELNKIKKDARGK